MSSISSSPVTKPTLDSAADPAVSAVLAALRQVAGAAANAPIGLHEPEFAGREWDYVKSCLDTGWVSSAGAFVDRFERELADYTGTRHCIATVNGTAALHLALRLAGVEAGDEVIVPTIGFIATCNAVSYCGAVPHLVDSNETTLGMDPAKLGSWLDEIAERRTGGALLNRRTGRRLAAIVPMHTFGHPVEIDALLELAARWNIPLVEDAAESLGSTYRGRHCGSFGRLAALSFNGNKIVTTGGGGAVLTDDAELARRAKHLSTTAKLSHRWRFDHDEVGYNYRLPNLNAALGCAQLERMPSFLARKRRLAESYRAAFAGIAGVRVFEEPAHAQSNYWLNVILVEPKLRDPILAATNEAGLMTRPAWTPMHRLPMYETAPRMDDLSVADEIERRLINLPSSAGLAGHD